MVNANVSIANFFIISFFLIDNNLHLYDNDYQCQFNDNDNQSQNDAGKNHLGVFKNFLLFKTNQKSQI